MTVDITHLTELKEQITENNKKIDFLTNAILALEGELRNTCPHSTYMVNEHYSHGGYDRLSSVTISHICTICGKVMKSYDDSSHHGSYA